MIARVTEMTGLDAEFVKFSGGRLETQAYLREVHREEGKLGSIYDSNVTSFVSVRSFPLAPSRVEVSRCSHGSGSRTENSEVEVSIREASDRAVDDGAWCECGACGTCPWFEREPAIQVATRFRAR